MKIVIDFGQMSSADLLILSRKCIREFNERGLAQFKVTEKN